jgi:hypothetical protein
MEKEKEKEKEKDCKTRQEKKGRRYKDPYNQKSLRIQEAMRERKKTKGQHTTRINTCDASGF